MADAGAQVGEEDGGVADVLMAKDGGASRGLAQRPAW